MNTTKRILWIDYTKAICIYLVLLGHAHVSQPIADFIYSFHMPLFFFLSGCLFSYDKHPTFREFALKRFKGLMVPYLWINLFTYLFWLLIGKNFGEDSSISIPWYSPLIGILTGNGSPWAVTVLAARWRRPVLSGAGSAERRISAFRCWSTLLWMHGCGPNQ